MTPCRPLQSQRRVRSPARSCFRPRPRYSLSAVIPRPRSLNSLPSGLTKGAFYFHFPSKKQLALAVIEEKQRQWVDSVQAMIKDEPRAIDQLRQVAFALVRLHRDDPSAFSVSRLTRDLARVPDVNDLVRDHTRAWVGMLAGLITRAQADGDLPRTIAAGDLAALLVAATDGLKDLGGLLDAPSRAARAFGRRMEALVTLVDALRYRATADAGTDADD
jgi:AcrR family transcriptional regulator